MLMVKKIVIAYLGALLRFLYAPMFESFISGRRRFLLFHDHRCFVSWGGVSLHALQVDEEGGVEDIVEFQR